LGRESAYNKQSDMPIKILIVMINAHDGCAECCLNWNVYDININYEFLNEMHAKNERHH